MPREGLLRSSVGSHGAAGCLGRWRQCSLLVIFVAVESRCHAGYLAATTAGPAGLFRGKHLRRRVVNPPNDVFCRRSLLPVVNGKSEQITSAP